MLDWLKKFLFIYVEIVNVRILDWLKFFFLNFYAGIVDVRILNWLKLIENAFIFNFYARLVNVRM